MYVTSIILLFLIISLVVSKRKDYKGLYSFDKTTTLPLRGVLALLIVSHHLGQRTDIFPLSNFTSGIGAPIVSIFFFISGYGLCLSYISKGENYFNGFLRKRLGKLLPKFIILTVGMMLIYHFSDFYTKPIDIQTKCLIFEGKTPLPNSWFIYAIVYIYISYFICSLAVRSPFKLGMLFTLSTILYIFVLAVVLQYQKYWYNTILCVNFGYFTAYYEKSISRFIEKNRLPSYALVIIALISSYELCGLSRAFYPVWMAVQAFSVYIIIRTLKFFHWKWLCQLGVYSLEIYLVHGIPLQLGQYIGLSNWTLWFFTYALSIVFAIFINYTFDLLSNSKRLYMLNINNKNPF
ncbi:MAG: acyltransferase [Muribaculaceae bacterium]|nr:acyltransferase [Muribaculaceae bacterium]